MNKWTDLNAKASYLYNEDKNPIKKEEEKLLQIVAIKGSSRIRKQNHPARTFGDW